MQSEEKQKSKRKTAWERFLARFAKRIEKHHSELREMHLRYLQETEEERKQELKSSCLEKSAPIFMVGFLKELASISDREFGRMMTEVSKAMEDKLEELGRDFLDFEVMTKDPVAVFQELLLTERLGGVVQKELERHEELFGDPKLLLRILALVAVRDISFGVVFATLRPFLEVLSMARNRLGINENWAIASFALNLEESLVKKKLSEFGVLKSKMKGSFHGLLEQLINLIETKEGRHLASDIFLSAGYRKIRNKLDHEGHLWKPTRKESNEIVRHLLRLGKALWEEDA